MMSSLTWRSRTALHWSTSSMPTSSRFRMSFRRGSWQSHPCLREILGGCRGRWRYDGKIPPRQPVASMVQDKNGKRRSLRTACSQALEAFKQGDDSRQLCTTCPCASTWCKCTSSPLSTGLEINVNSAVRQVDMQLAHWSLSSLFAIFQQADIRRPASLSDQLYKKTHHWRHLCGRAET